MPAHKLQYTTRLSRFTRNMTSFVSGRSGSVGLTFGLALLPMLLAIGGAVDYGAAVRSKAKVQQAIDAATLAAAKAAAQVASNTQYSASCTTPSASFNPQNSGAYGGGGCPSAINAAAVSAAASVLASYPDLVTKMKLAPALAVNNSGGSWNATISFGATAPTSFVGILGMKSVALKGSSSASTSVASNIYVNFYLLLDNSQSMAIGSTSADIQKTVALTGCAVGCHTAGYSSYYYDMPKANGVRFRIDDLRSATLSMVSQAQSTVSSNPKNMLSMGVYNFDHAVTPLVELTSNLTSVYNAVQNLNLPTYDDGTQIQSALNWISSNKIIGYGKGKSSSSPLEVLFLVTDGVEDGIYTGYNSTYAPSGWGGYTGALSPAACDAIKSKGVTVAIVYTTYYSDPNTWQFPYATGPFYSNIASNLQSCASPGYFFQATNSSDITTAMQQLFSKAIAAIPVKLTN